MSAGEHMQVGNRTSSVTERELITAINQVEMLGSSMRGLADQIREMRDEMREDRKTNAKDDDLERIGTRVTNVETRVTGVENKLSAGKRDIAWIIILGGGIITALTWVLQRFAA